MKNRIDEHPPWLLRLILRFSVRQVNDPSYLGDCVELYRIQQSENGKFRADLWLFKQLIISLPAILFHRVTWASVMFYNTMKISYRNLKTNKVYSVINLAGLSTGLACSILIALFIFDELSFDRHHQVAHRIYRVGTVRGSDQRRGSYTSPPMAAAMKQDFPEIESITRLCLWDWDRLVVYGEKKFVEKRIIGADSTVFQVLTLPLLAGDPDKALTRPNTVVISRSTAEKYFGDENPVGKSLAFDGPQNQLEVTGVMEDCPRTSHLQYDLIFSMESLDMTGAESWMNHTFVTYLKLRESVPKEQLESKFQDFLIRHYGANFHERTGQDFRSYLNTPGGENYYNYWMQPFLDIHLNADVTSSADNTGDIRYVYIFSAIAFFVLLIACINFMNLSTARFARRSKEVGLRKVVGAHRFQLMSQFMGESVLFSVLSLLAACIVVLILLPHFRVLTNRSIPLMQYLNWRTGLILVGFAGLVGILAGSYPAVFLSSFTPVRVIRGGIDGRPEGKNGLRRVLVVLQFSISIAILICTFVVFSQLKYVRNRKLGFDDEQILVLHRAYATGNQREAFNQELLKDPNILKISKTSTTPGRHYNGWHHHLEGKPRTESIVLRSMYADLDFIEVMGLEMVQGRYFQRDMPTDQAALVVNEAAIREMGLEGPVGKRLHYQDDWGFLPILGIVKDFHFESLHLPVRPMVIYPIFGNGGGYSLVRMATHDIRRTIGFIEETWTTFSGGEPFEYTFLDDDFHRLYMNEERTGKLLGSFTFIAIMIACLGLFGLVSYSVEERTKEIGVRKVLGASESRILFLLSKEVLVLLCLAVVVASPASWFFMKGWLQNFAYRIGLSALFFLLAGLSAVAIAVLTTSYLTVRAARANPADSLRYE